MDLLAAQCRQALLEWFDRQARDLPWRRQRTPYRIWLSEIMLQQTRVETVLPYYRRFLEHYPDVQALAAAPDDEVMALWAGLGYYSRARNLLACAREIAGRYGGRFPDRAEELGRLPGLGTYTVAAVGSLAFGLPLAVLDGNVARVLCRLFAIEEDPKAPATRKRLQGLADQLLDARRAGAWNEAMMELGARVCRPRKPLCADCPVAPACRALAEGRTDELPLRPSRRTVRLRATLLLVVVDPDGRRLARRRDDKGMLRGLWELPGAESPLDDLRDLADSWDHLRQQVGRALGLQADDWVRQAPFTHVFSHFTAHVLPCVAARQGPAPDGWMWLTTEEIDRLGFSTRDRKALAACVTGMGSLFG